MKARRRTTLTCTAAAAAAILAGAAGCGGGAAKQTAASATQTITVSLQGLGAETTETETQIKAFEAANPNIKVKPLVLSPQASTLYQQLTQRFVAGSGTPDVILSDVVWPAQFAKAGWILNLDQFHPNMSQFFPAQVQTGTYNGHTYGIPWFSNAEGLYYRKDLIKTPPTTPQELVADAKAAMAKDSSLKEGLAFEGDKYEGAVTSYVDFLGGFGGKLDSSNLDTPQNQAALQFEHDTIYKDKIAPTAVTGWQEQQVENAWTSGQTAFAVNWPYMIADSAKAPAVAGKVGFTTFPSQTGTPASALGGDDLVINAKSAHQGAAWKFITFLTSVQQQVARAIPTGDAPAVSAAFNDQLYAGAPYFKDAAPVFKVVQNRPVSAQYPQVSDDLQTMLSSVLANQSSPSSALHNAASQIKSLG